MRIQKVETTQKRDEPEGSITLIFHHGPESIWLKIKPAGLRSDRVAFTEDRAGQVSHQMRLPLSNLCLFMWKWSCCLPNCESVLYSRSLIPAKWKTEAKTGRHLQTDGLHLRWHKQTWIMFRFHSLNSCDIGMWQKDDICTGDCHKETFGRSIWQFSYFIGFLFNVHFSTMSM